MRTLFFLSAALLFCGCTSTDTKNVRSGLLMIGQPNECFLKEWGPPTRTYTQFFSGNRFEAVSTSRSASEQQAVTNTTQNTSTERHFAIKGGKNYELWDYEKRGVTLVFDRRRLTAWNYHDGSKAH